MRRLLAENSISTQVAMLPFISQNHKYTVNTLNHDFVFKDIGGQSCLDEPYKVSHSKFVL